MKNKLQHIRGRLYKIFGIKSSVREISNEMLIIS